MLKANQKQFLLKAKTIVNYCVDAEEGANIKEKLETTLENMKAGRDGNWGSLPAWQHPAVLSQANMQYFIQSVGGNFEYCEAKQIKALAWIYCENETETAAYVERWNKVLDRKGYEPIVEHYAYIMLKGLIQLLKENKINIEA